MKHIFANISPRAREIRKKINKRDYIKLESYWTANETIIKMKRESLEATEVPISKWVDPKTMVHLHNGILRSREKEEAYTLWNSMGGTGEHYAKWNKPDSERQIPYDLTYKWNLMNKIN